MISKTEIFNTEITGNLGPYLNIGKVNLVPDISNNPSASRIQYFGYFFINVPLPIYRTINLVMNSSIAIASTRNITKYHLLNTINNVLVNSTSFLIKTHLLNTLSSLSNSVSRQIFKSHILNTSCSVSVSSIRNIVKTHFLNMLNSVSVKATRNITKYHLLNTINNLINIGSVHYKNDWGNVGSVWVKTKQITYQVRSVIKRKISL